LSILSGLYGRAAAWRRAWYGRDPQRRRRLEQPVISVGNLSVGGSGKTPTVAALAQLLRELGERPAILSRGYARREESDGVVVVSDGTRVLEPVMRSGDEPQMLARMLSGVPVLVARERYLAGCLAERTFGATVHLLDDGFQHYQLARDLDLLILAAEDLEERLLPSGRLREPLDAAAHAHALLVPAGGEEAVARRFPAADLFTVSREYGTLPEVRRVVAVAGIARPQRFFDALRAQGLEIVREMPFRDHHWYKTSDVDAIARAARELGADAVVTTDKDLVRFDAVAPAASAARVLALPMRIAIEPRERFAEWLRARLRVVRASRSAA